MFCVIQAMSLRLIPLLMVCGCVLLHLPVSAQQGTKELVGRVGTNRVVTPVNQVLTPYGRQVELAGLRPQAIALSPNGKLLVTSGKSSKLIVVDPETGVVRQRVSLPSEKVNRPTPEVASANILHPDKAGQLSFTGLIFSPGGSRIYLANVDG